MSCFCESFAIWNGYFRQIKGPPGKNTSRSGSGGLKALPTPSSPHSLHGPSEGNTTKTSDNLLALLSWTWCSQSSTQLWECWKCHLFRFSVEASTQPFQSVLYLQHHYNCNDVTANTNYSNDSDGNGEQVDLVGNWRSHTHRNAKDVHCGQHTLERLCIIPCGDHETKALKSTPFISSFANLHPLECWYLEID